MTLMSSAYVFIFSLWRAATANSLLPAFCRMNSAKKRARESEAGFPPFSSLSPRQDSPNIAASMKPPFLSLFAVCLGLAAFAVADELPKNLATYPVPREGGWMKQHESFNEISKKGEAPLVFLGDSITAGWAPVGKKKGGEEWAKSWAPLGAANFGIGGDRTEHVLWRLEHGNFDGLHPKLIVLMIGTNNTGHVGKPQKELNGAIYHSSPEDTAEGVKAILDHLQKKMPDTKILLLGIFPRGDNEQDKLRQTNEATNTLIAKFADGSKIQYLDIGKKFLEPDGTLSTDIMPDHLHPNAKGYEIWTAAIKDKVAEMMK